jgi:hypothetical protein
MDSISLECGVLAEPGFRVFSQGVVPFCHITTRVESDPDQDLFAAKGGVEYPRVVFMDAKGKVVYAVQGSKLVDFRRGLKELQELEALRKRVAAKDRHAEYPFLKKQLELQHIEFLVAKKVIRNLPRLTQAQKLELAPLLLRAEVHRMVSRTGESKKARAKTGERFFRMKKVGKVPMRDALFPFWMHILDYAESRKKAHLYEEALDSLKQEFSGRDWKEQDRTLRKLQTG